MVCPYDDDEHAEAVIPNDIGPRPATGCLVYDSSDFDSLMNDLDEYSKK